MPFFPGQPLLLVIEPQEQGERRHWYLFVGEEGTAGTVYQVTCDAASMRYKSFSHLTNRPRSLTWSRTLPPDSERAARAWFDAVLS